MKLCDFVCFDAAISELKSEDRNGAITELVDSLGNSGRLGRDNGAKITRAVIKRENEASTGMGKGVAIPHVKHSAVKQVTATVGQSPVGIDFCSLDKEPVYTVLLIISPVDDPDKHLQAMEQIFKHLQQEKFRKFLRQANTPELLEDLFREADEDGSAF